MIAASHRLLATLPLILLAAGSATTQPVDRTPERFSFDPDLTYSDAVPAPSEALGYELGTECTLYAYAVDHLRTVAEASDRVALKEYGETYEGRLLVYLVVTSAENQGRLDTLKRNSRHGCEPQREPRSAGWLVSGARQGTGTQQHRAPGNAHGAVSAGGRAPGG